MLLPASQLLWGSGNCQAESEALEVWPDLKESRFIKLWRATASDIFLYAGAEHSPTRILRIEGYVADLLDGVTFPIM